MDVIRLLSVLEIILGVVGIGSIIRDWETGVENETWTEHRPEHKEQGKTSEGD